MNRNRPGAEKAAWHEAMARGYRRDALGLLAQGGHPFSAGALLYESAKQCINAVANQRGVNPVATQAKLDFLRGLAEQEPELPDLLTNWRAATRLHSHADQGHLDAAEFAGYLALAQAFIDEMLLLYAGGS